MSWLVFGASNSFHINIDSGNDYSATFFNPYTHFVTFAKLAISEVTQRLINVFFVILFQG